MRVKEVMVRSAADNAYMHKDFHGALSRALIYLQEHYGDEAVRDYLRQFARSFHAPLTQAVNERGLIALKEYYEHIYAIEADNEDGAVSITLSDDEMVMSTPANPAVVYLREHNQPVAPLFDETIRTVSAAICEDTPYAAAVLSYDEATGGCTVRFARRQP
jgi:hypothetical protein